MFDINALLMGHSGIVALSIIFLIIFAETGLLIGFFLPGDTLLFTAGFFAAQGSLPLAGVIVTIFAAAIIGDNVGYYIGKKSGPALLKREDSIFFKKSHIHAAEKFYKKYGAITIVVARFIAFIRTFTPVVAGISNMPRRTFIIYNVVGAAIWTGSVVMAGYYFGGLISPETLERYVVLIIGGALTIFIVPIIYRLIQAKFSKQSI